MPIEIKELHIHVSVNTPSSQGSTGKPMNGMKAGDDEGSDDKDAIIAECVEQVMQILQNKKER